VRELQARRNAASPASYNVSQATISRLEEQHR
jgi:hypothetical protein